MMFRVSTHAEGLEGAEMLAASPVSRIGGRPRQRMAAYALVVDSAGLLLLVRQPDGRGRLGRWLLPGGGVEFGEHPEQTVIREVREETGLRIRVGVLLDVVSDITRVGRRRRALHNVRLIYRVTVTPGDSLEHQLFNNARWYSQPECGKLPLEPFTAEVLERLP
jgi:8-oxo-dGTP pyrophosphatase MutT (NUDIX family)